MLSSSFAGRWARVSRLPPADVRAANELRALGTELAVERLRAYARIARLWLESPIPLTQSAGFADVGSAFLLTSLVFEVPNGASRPPYHAGLASPAQYGLTPPDPHDPFYVLEGLPLLCAWWVNGHIGPVQSFEPYFAERAAVADVPREPLVPCDDPIVALERAYPRLFVRWTGFDNLAVDNDVRGQVWRALAPLVGSPPRPEQSAERSGIALAPIRGDEWQSLKERVRALGGVHWDAAAQRYAAGPRR
jgi:hypothetical protein